MFCSFFSKFASTEHANVRGVPPGIRSTRVPRARRVQHTRCQSSSSRNSSRPAPSSSRPSGQRSQGVQGQARQGLQTQEAGGLARDGAAFAHGQGLQAHEGDAVAHMLPTLFSSALSGGRSPRHYAPTLVRAGGLPARARRRVYIIYRELIYRELIYYGLYFLRFTTEAPIDEISGAPNKDMTKPWVVSDETLTTNEFPHF